ncbi:MAG: twin-arginine translocation signal domain-containing protein, partial [Pseudomonadota bacterium]
MAENQANGAPSPLRDDARRLILRERLDGRDPEESAELVAWRRQSVVHETAFQDEMRVWSLATQALGSTAYPKFSNDRARPSRRHFITGATVAASAAGVGFVGIVEGSLPGYTDLVSDHSTGRGEQRSIRLNGDVSVILDGDTALN